MVATKTTTTALVPSHTRDLTVSLGLSVVSSKTSPHVFAALFIFWKNKQSKDEKLIDAKNLKESFAVYFASVVTQGDSKSPSRSDVTLEFLQTFTDRNSESN